MPKALVLDFGGVISRTMFETHALSEKALGLEPGSLSWRGPFDPQNDPEWRAMQAGEMSERDYWSLRMSETAALAGENWTEFSQFVGRVRGADPAAVIRPQALSAITEAKVACKRLAILSNELDLFYGSDFREKLPFLKSFEAIIDATHTGILKPAPRAFEQVMKALDLPARECLFVDDQPKNIAGAKAVGMHVVPFDVTQPSASWSNVRQKLGLRELPDVII